MLKHALSRLSKIVFFSTLISAASVAMGDKKPCPKISKAILAKIIKGEASEFDGTKYSVSFMFSYESQMGGIKREAVQEEVQGKEVKAVWLKKRSLDKKKRLPDVNSRCEYSLKVTPSSGKKYTLVLSQQE